jgi:UDP-N-acetylglucosamine acyltransferase
MPDIHPTAVVDREAELAPDCVIGPGCVLRGRVKLAAGVNLISSVQLNGPVEIGAGTNVYPFACLGFPGQDFKFKPGMPTPGVKVGSGCILREGVTIHAATKETSPTTIGNNVMMMVGSHVGHDGFVGNNVIMVNGAVMAGHSAAHDNSTIGGLCAIHQFTRIGRLSFMSGGTAVSMDVPPFCVVSDRQRLGGINRVGMRRSGMDRGHITRVDEAFRRAFRNHLPRAEQIAILDELGRDCPPVMEIAEFVRQAKRAICPGMGRPPRTLTTWLHLRRRGKLASESAGDDGDDNEMG